MLVREYRCDNDYCEKTFKLSLMSLALRQKIVCPHCEQEYYPVNEGSPFRHVPSMIAAILSIFLVSNIESTNLKLVLIVIYMLLINLLITYVFYELNIFKVVLTKRQY